MIVGHLWLVSYPCLKKSVHVVHFKISLPPLPLRGHLPQSKCSLGRCKGNCMCVMLFSLTAVRKWNVPWTPLKRKLWPTRKSRQYETLPFTYTPWTGQVTQVVSPVVGVALSPHLVTKILEDQPWSQVLLGTEGLELSLHKNQTHPGICPPTPSSVTTEAHSPRLLALAMVAQEGSRAKHDKVGTLLRAPTNETRGLDERLLRRRTTGRETGSASPRCEGKLEANRSTYEDLPLGAQAHLQLKSIVIRGHFWPSARDPF